MSLEKKRQRSGLAEMDKADRPGDQSPRNLIEGCQGLVRSLAWKVHQKLPPHVDLEDLISSGQVGLAEAARDFDPSRGGKFITYAYYRIRGAIFDGLSKMSWFSLREYHSSRYERMANEILRQDAEDRGEGGIADLEGEVRWLKGVSSRLSVVYLVFSGGQDEGEDQVDVVDGSSPAPPVQASRDEIRERLHQLIEALPTDAGSLIRGMYFDGLSLTEAAGRLGISKAWASRLHSRTLDRLANALRLLGVSGLDDDI